MLDRYLQKTIIWLFHFWLLVVPFVFTAINDELFEFNKMIFTYAITTIIGAVWISRMIITKKIIWKHSFLFWPIALYLLSHIFSTVLSIHPHTSVFGYYSRFHGGLLSTITYTVMFFAFISNINWKNIPHLIRTSLIATLGVCFYAIPEHFGVSPSCILITGEATASCWVQDVQTRVFATFGQPNWLAAYLLMMIPLAWWYTAISWKEVVLKKNFWNITLGASVFFLSIITLLYTRSRSGFLGLAFELAFFILTLGGLHWHQHKKSLQQTPLKYLSALLALLLGAGLIIALLGSPFSPSLAEIAQKASTGWQTEQTPADPNPTPLPTSAPTPASGTVLENGGTDSGNIRRIVWKGALHVWQRYPLFGSGLDTFAYSYYLDRPMEHNQVSEWDFLYNRAHNEFLNTLATTGTFGFLALMFLMSVFVFGMLKDIWKLTLSTDQQTVSPQHLLPALLLLALIAGYGGLAISNFFGFSTVAVGALFFLYKAFWETLRRSWTHPEEIDPHSPSSSKQVAIELLKAPKRNKKTKYIPTAKTKTSRSQAVPTKISWNESIFGIIGVGIVSLFLLGHIWNMWYNDHLLSLTKGYLSQGSGTLAYTTVQDLVRRAPLEPTYIDQQSNTLARLAAGTFEQDATTAGRLAEEAVAASNKAVKLNPVHLNYWKNRARVFIMLATLDQQYYIQALEALHRGRELAPTDVKLVYNIGLILDAINETASAHEAYQDTIAMKPDYEEARNSYGQFLERQGEYQRALEQYTYVIEHLNPTAPTALERIEALNASISGKIKEDVKTEPSQ